MGGLVQQPAALGAHRQHPAGRSRGTLLRHAGTTCHGGVTQTKWPPTNPGRFKSTLYAYLSFYDRVPKLVADLVRSRVEVIVLDSTVATEVAKRSTSTIPLVMALVVDPVGSGLVKSLVHPGENVTGLSMMTTELNSKRLQLLQEVTPQLTRTAVSWNPDHPFHAKVLEDLKVIASSLLIELSSVGVRTPEQFGPAFSDVSRAKAQALYVVEDPIFFAHRMTFLELEHPRPGCQPSTNSDASRRQAPLMSYGQTSTTCSVEPPST
jgi:hypothetical protein